MVNAHHVKGMIVANVCTEEPPNNEYRGFPQQTLLKD